MLHTTQDRLRERNLLRRLGLPCAQHAAVRTEAELREAVATVGTPGILKTAAWGYDGKGQRRIGSAADALAAWLDLGQAPTVYEEVVPFVAEVSMVAARNLSGEVVCFPLFLNEHSDHILDITTCPAPQALADGSPVGPEVQRQAQEITRSILTGLEAVGVLCVEMFLLADGSLLVNEIAPRPHNSGHLTIDAHSISQFEMQVRAICGLPLGNPAQLAPAAMVNLLGDLWQGDRRTSPGPWSFRGVTCTSTGRTRRAPDARWATSR